MANPAGLESTTRLYRPSMIKRPSRLTAFLGRDWKVALPFVLPIVIMAGLILWPFINAILISMTVRSFVTRTDTYVGWRTTDVCYATPTT